MTSGFKFKFMLSCIFILRKLNRSTVYQIPKHLLKKTRKGQPLEQYKKSDLYLVIFSEHYGLDMTFDKN